MNRACVWLAVTCLLSPSVGGGAWAGGGKDPMNIEDGALDEIHLKVAAINAGVPVLLRPFSVEGVDLGTGGENAKKETRSQATGDMVKTAPEILATALKSALIESGKFKEVLPADATAVPESALVVEGRFLKIDPGSKAKRYWGGFGAGKSGVQVTGTVRDGTGRVLAEFTHMKHSGIGMFGGDYAKFLTDDTTDVGRDIGHFLVKWAGGVDLHKD